MKAQSATEYLLSYSWAILALTALIVVLLIIGLPNIANSEPERCSFPVGSIGCENFRVDTGGASNAVRLNQLTVSNSFNKKIYICNLMCSEAPLSAIPMSVPACGGNVLKQSIEPGKNAILNIVPVSCTDNSGQSVNLAVNSLYRGKLYLFYSYEDETSGPANIATGELVARVGQA
jgi:hypothetical protein